jgi:hypothetical protein
VAASLYRGSNVDDPRSPWLSQHAPNNKAPPPPTHRQIIEPEATSHKESRDIGGLICRCLNDTDKILEVGYKRCPSVAYGVIFLFQSLDSFNDLSNEMFDRFIELGPQLVNTLRWVQDALNLDAKTLQKLNYDELWVMKQNELLASLSRWVSFIKHI